ncbi:MAG: hypothetical protein ACKVW3_16710 [Phycisphaerales bacterium]
MLATRFISLEALGFAMAMEPWYTLPVMLVIAWAAVSKVRSGRLPPRWRTNATGR